MCIKAERVEYLGQKPHWDLLIKSFPGRNNYTFAVIIGTKWKKQFIEQYRHPQFLINLIHKPRSEVDKVFIKMFWHKFWIEIYVVITTYLNNTFTYILPILSWEWINQWARFLKFTRITIIVSFNLIKIYFCPPIFMAPLWKIFTYFRKCLELL